MADKPKVMLGGTAIKPPERHGMEAIKYLIYNPDTGEVFTRTPKSWALITVFYLIYYSCLAAFWAMCLIVFLKTLPEGQPKWTTKGSLIGDSPGLGMRPVQTDKLIDSSMISYLVGSKKDEKNADGSTYQGWEGWVNRTKDFLGEYDLEDGKNKHGVKLGKDVKRFDPTSSLDVCAQGNFGYDVGKPCVFLKLNKIFDLEHDYYTKERINATFPEKMPQELKDHIKATPGEYVWIDCRPEYPADIEALEGKIKYFPAARGFPAEYFPYKNQAGYQSPLVAVQFDASKAKGQLLHVECRAWAGNIGYNRRDRIGIVRFEILLRP